MRYAAFLLVACGWSEQRFEVVGIERLCEAASTCAGTYDTPTCVDRLRATDRSACDFDPQAAKDCVAEVEEAACTPIEPFGVSELAVPEACAVAWDCPWIDLSAF